jgi:glyoxylase-like metal-dependent hydrolase (beta-lactamase superfamily II)
MADWRIHTLSTGDLLLPGFHESGDWIPSHAWALTDGTHWVLVDSGMPSPEEMRTRLKVEARGGGTETLCGALAEIGVKPADIGTLILTHLHFDHAWNLDLFPAAQIVVQRDELIHAIDPVPTQRIYYFKPSYVPLLERRRPSGLRLVDGDAIILPGLEVMKAPGHTPGLQAVLARTARGTVGLVSDLGEEYASWFPADPRATKRPMNAMRDAFRPGSIRSESELTYIASMRRVLTRADIVVPAHDDRIPRQMPDEWWAIPGEAG